MKVEELVKELREQERSLQYNAIEYGCVDSGIAANVASQAADKLEELAAALAEKDKEIAELRDALAQIDALDPEEHAAGFSVYALRGVVERMGEIARAALKEVGDVG